jgi:SAM-dependent methyltransferase
MSALPRPAQPDALRPTAEQAIAAWGDRVRSERDQVNRCREIEDPADFYAPIAERFRHDPRRSGDSVLDGLLALTRPDETWLDIGAGGGRYALPIALHVREVIAVDPSEGMLGVLRDGLREHRITNVRPVKGRWPLDGDEPSADVSLMAHVGYDIEGIGPFLDAMEAATKRLCVAVLAAGAMTTVATLFWQPVHGEVRIPLPALPELLGVLMARGRLPAVALEDRVPATFDTYDDLVTMARRQLWVRPGSAKDRELQRLVKSTANQRDGRWALDWSRTRIGVVTWEPR